jgi:hypothetical protein
MCLHMMPHNGDDLAGFDGNDVIGVAAGGL